MPSPFGTPCQLRDTCAGDCRPLRQKLRCSARNYCWVHCRLSLILASATEAKRREVFAATAAVVAVQVMYYCRMVSSLIADPSRPPLQSRGPSRRPWAFYSTIQRWLRAKFSPTMQIMGPQLTTKAPTHGFRIISSGSPAWPPCPSLATPEHQAYIDFHRSEPGLDSKAARGCTSSHTEKAPRLPSLANPNHGSGEYYYPQAPRHHLNIGSPCAAELRELASSMAFQRRRWRDDRQRRCQCLVGITAHVRVPPSLLPQRSGRSKPAWPRCLQLSLGLKL